MVLTTVFEYNFIKENKEIVDYQLSKKDIYIINS